MGGEGHYMQVSSWKVPPGFKQNQTATKTPLLWLLKGSQLALEMFTADIVCEKMMKWWNDRQFQEPTHFVSIWSSILQSYL